MRRSALAVAAGLVALAALGPGAAPARAGHDALSLLLPGNPLDGSRIFAEKGCVLCHSIQGVGGTAGPDLGRGILNHPLLEIAGVMWNHTPGMEYGFRAQHIARPTFEPAEMASLLAFLYYVGALDPVGDPTAGARVFQDKSCGTCHSVGGKGGRVGPPLDRYGIYASPVYLTTALWQHARPMAEKMRQMNVARPTFQSNEIPDVLAYLRSASGHTERVYASTGSPKRGEGLFREKRCAECHAVRGHGGGVGPDLGVVLKGSLTRITGAMWNHAPFMWAKMAERGIAVPSLNVEQMSDLVSYLYFLQFMDPPGDARRGLVVFRDKNCGACHGAAKSGAPSVSMLVAKLKSPLEIVTAMWNHAGKMGERTAEANVAWPVLKGGEMADLVAYLLSNPQASAQAGVRSPRAGGEPR